MLHVFLEYGCGVREQVPCRCLYDMRIRMKRRLKYKCQTLLFQFHFYLQKKMKQCLPAHTIHMDLFLESSLGSRAFSSDFKCVINEAKHTKIPHQSNVNAIKNLLDSCFFTFIFFFTLKKSWPVTCSQSKKRVDLLLTPNHVCCDFVVIAFRRCHRQLNYVYIFAILYTCSPFTWQSMSLSRRVYFTWNFPLFVRTFFPFFPLELDANT